MLNTAQKEAEQILNYITEKYDLIDITIKVKDIQSGRAIYNTCFVSIPLWAYDEGLHFFYYYVLHELSHFIARQKDRFCESHGKLFKTIENELLADFGLKPVYAKAYVKELKLSNGKSVYKDK
jgi:predicted SprT family Zn-dependent metalloprotease